MNTKKMRIVLDDGAYMPVRGHKTDAGLDLRTPKDVTVPAKGSVIVDTGVHVELPPREDRADLALREDNHEISNKNGTKIFEGDVVTLTTDSQKTYRVVFEDGCFFFDNIRAWYTADSLNSRNIAVIGNIHDNPELLEG